MSEFWTLSLFFPPTTEMLLWGFSSTFVYMVKYTNSLLTVQPILFN